MLSRTLSRAVLRGSPSRSTPISTTFVAMTRPSAALSTTTTPTTTRALSTARPLRAAASHDDHGHDSHYDPPAGWLWGIPPGEKRQREGWEIPFFVLYCGSVVVAVVAYTMKEDTSIQTWALEEARRRLEKEGLLEDPEK